jgi:hypothetical protein
MSFNNENFNKLIDLSTVDGFANIIISNKENEIIWQAPTK